MKQKEGFGLRNVCGENVLVAEGLKNINYCKIINLNETAAYLWKNLEDKEFTIEDMVALLLEEYDVTEEVALKDCTELANKWIEAELVER